MPKTLFFCVLLKKSGFREILGLTYKEKNKIEVNEDGPLIEDINVLPIPDRSLIPYEKYLEKTSKIYFFPKNKPIGTLFSARGCPFRCIFCSTQKSGEINGGPEAQKIY